MPVHEYSVIRIDAELYIIAHHIGRLLPERASAAALTGAMQGPARPKLPSLYVPPAFHPVAQHTDRQQRIRGHPRQTMQRNVVCGSAWQRKGADRCSAGPIG